METSASTVTTPAAARVVLRPRKALPFYGRHPWVLESAVDRVEPMSAAGEHFLDLDGQVVDLVNEKGRFIARGIFNGESRIRVRMFTWSAEESLDEAFFRRRLQAAIDLRGKIGYQPQSADTQNATQDAHHSTSATRLVFSEADGLSVWWLIATPIALSYSRHRWRWPSDWR